jgi:hypothetical protein
MKIYEKQLVALGKAKKRDFEDRIVEFLQTHVPAAARHAGLEDEVHAHVLAADAFGLGTERQIAAYVLGAWVFGDDFLARIEPLRPKLIDDCIAPETKAQMLLDEYDRLEAATK